jgi:hypothetical protein
MEDLTVEEKQCLIIRYLSDSVEYLNDISSTVFAEKIEKIKKNLEIEFETDNKRFMDVFS